jgi:hypothetical protein
MKGMKGIDQSNHDLLGLNYKNRLRLLSFSSPSSLLKSQLVMIMDITWNSKDFLNEKWLIEARLR